jgi:hypothetical protein
MWASRTGANIDIEHTLKFMKKAMQEAAVDTADQRRVALDCGFSPSARHKMTLCKTLPSMFEHDITALGHERPTACAKSR